MVRRDIMRRTATGSVVVFLVLMLANCAGPVATADKTLARAVLGDGVSFGAGANPFIYNSTIKRNSSDPAGVWAPTAAGNVLLLVTSSDLKTTVPVTTSLGDKNYYPMDKTYLYVLDPTNTGNDTWRDFGAVLAEKDIPWA